MQKCWVGLYTALIWVTLSFHTINIEHTFLDEFIVEYNSQLTRMA